MALKTTYELQNDNINKAKINANQQAFNQRAVDTLGADFQQELDAYNRQVQAPLYNSLAYQSMYNTKLNSLTKEYSDLNDQLNNLVKSKYGADYDVSKGYPDTSDYKNYAEYVRLNSLMQENENARQKLEENEANRQAAIIERQNARTSQQKYLDEYAKMQGMGYGGYSAGLQAKAINDYINAAAEINKTARNNETSALQDYRNAERNLNEERNANIQSGLAKSLEDYNTALQNITTLEDFEKLNNSYKEVLNDYKKVDPNFENTLNQQKGYAFLGEVANIDENGNITKLLTPSEYLSYKNKYNEYYNSLSSKYKKNLDQLYLTGKLSGLDNTTSRDNIKLKYEGNTYNLSVYYKNKSAAEAINKTDIVKNNPDPYEGQMITDEKTKTAWIYLGKKYGWALVEIKGSRERAYDKFKNELGF